MTNLGKVGRPKKYTKEIGNEICKRLMLGDSLRTICKNKKLPSATTIFNWLADEEFNKETKFLEQYERAREIQADYLADELIDIADDGRNDYMERKGKNGQTYNAINTEHVQRSRLRIDTRKWIASKLKPKKYGEKMDLTSDGEKLEGPVPYLPKKDDE
jgi:hypothetical protein